MLERRNTRSSNVVPINVSYLHEKLKYEAIFARRLLPTILLPRLRDVDKLRETSRYFYGSPGWSFEIPCGLGIIAGASFGEECSFLGQRRITTSKIVMIERKPDCTSSSCNVTFHRNRLKSA